MGPKQLTKRAIPGRYRDPAKRLYYRTLTTAKRQAILAGRVRRQAERCREQGSPLYAGLLERTAVDVEAGGPCWDVLRGHEIGPPAVVGGLPLRFLAAVHLLVLRGDAPALAPYYPSVGGIANEGSWPAFAATVDQHRQELQGLLEHSCQTNAVGRCAALVGGFLVAARDTGRPIRQFEPGASAGLNLRWDHYRYEIDGAAWGNPASPVRLANRVVSGRPPFEVATQVIERAGCDLAPLDPACADDQVALLSFTWADQEERLSLVRGALEVAERVPVVVERAEASEWVASKLEAKRPGALTIVFHSFLTRYLDERSLHRLLSAIEEAGKRASESVPLAWLRMEGGQKSAELRLTMWPGGDTRLLAVSGNQGNDIHWLASD
jgi:hypothetical protein